ncbi:CBL-interacting serine/threonine-protein kinase 1 [Podila epigama]|nr:CBL-interacting serine/threonine-protein kinase 1 [Podila epigama]
MSVATTTTTPSSTCNASAKFGLLSLSATASDAKDSSICASPGRRTRTGTISVMPSINTKRCSSMSFNLSTPTSVTRTKLSGPSNVNFRLPLLQRQRQHRSIQDPNILALAPLKTSHSSRSHSFAHSHSHSHKKTHSIQLGTKHHETPSNSNPSNPRVQSPLQQSHIIDWDALNAQARAMETEPDGSCPTCKDSYVYMAPCEHHPSKGRTEYLINDIFPKLTHDLSTIEFGIRIADFMPLAFKTVPVVGLAERELQLLHGLSNLPNVIHLQDSFVNDQGDTVLVLPMLKTFDCHVVNSSLCNVRKTMQQILTGLAAVHDKNIAHLDINPSNLMMTHDKKDVVIIDFGLSMTVDRTGHNNAEVPLCGTTGYIAPEVMHRDHYERHDPTLSDVYALGIVLGQMLEPYIPDCDLHYFGSKYLGVENTNQTVTYLKDFVAQGASYPCILTQAADLLRTMLEENPKDRKSAKELLKSHPFLAPTSAMAKANLKLCDWVVRVQEIKYHKYLYQEQEGCDVYRYR